MKKSTPSSAHKSRHLVINTLATIGLFLLADNIAVAQEQAETDESTEESSTEKDFEVILIEGKKYVPTSARTASKSDIPLVEIPQSISVITRKQIDQLNFIDAQQAVRYVSGVSGENFGPDLRFDFIAIRGFSPRQFVDGLATPVSTTIPSNGVDLYAFQTLDILKGPASVLYGSAPPGGIYNQTSRRAEYVTSGEIIAQIASDDYKQVAGTATSELTEGLAGRFTFLYRDRGAERDFVEAERVLIAPTFNIELGDNTDLDLLFYYQDDTVDGDTNGFLPAVGTLLENPLGQIDASRNLGEPDFNFYERDQFGIGFDLTHGFSDNLSLQTNFRYSDYSENRDVIFGTGLLEDNRTVTRGNSPYAEDVENIAADIRLAWNTSLGSVGHKLLFGFDYNDVDNEAGFGFVAASPIDLFEPVYGQGGDVSPGVTTRFNDQQVLQTGIYVQDQISIGNFRILGNIRHDKFDSDQLTPFAPLSAEAEVTNREQEETTFRIGANYIFDNGVSPYVSYSTSFQPVLGNDVNTGEQFEPTTGDQVEAGIKFDGRQLRKGFDIYATFAVFKINQKDVVTTGSNPNLVVFGAQVGEVEVTGAETEIVLRIDDNFSFNGSYSYTNSEIVASNLDIEIGADLPVTPRHNLALLADYTMDNGFGFNLGARYTSGSAGSIPTSFNPEVIDGESAFLVDANARYDFENWRLSVNASNLFDKEYVARCATLSNCNFGAGRQVIATVAYRL